jgi:hypothetical protein
MVYFISQTKQCFYCNKRDDNEKMDAKRYKLYNFETTLHIKKINVAYVLFVHFVYYSYFSISY